MPQTRTKLAQAIAKYKSKSPNCTAEFAQPSRASQNYVCVTAVTVTE